MSDWRVIHPSYIKLDARRLEVEDSPSSTPYPINQWSSTSPSQPAGNRTGQACFFQHACIPCPCWHLRMPGSNHSISRGGCSQKLKKKFDFTPHHFIQELLYPTYPLLIPFQALLLLLPAVVVAVWWFKCRTTPTDDAYPQLYPEMPTSMSVGYFGQPLPTPQSDSGISKFHASYP